MAKNDNPYNERSYRDLLWLLTVLVACDENKNNYFERGEVNPFAGALMAAAVSKGDRQDFDFLWDMIIATGAHFFLGKGKPSKTEEEKREEKERHAWRSTRTYDWIEYDVDPDDYDTEEEYEEALEEVKYAWREDYEDAFFDYGVDPELYDTEDEFLEDLDEARYGWRDDYTREWFEYGVDPDDYETEEDFLEDLEEAKYGWREDHRFDANDLDPDDYETEEEYLEAAGEEEEAEEEELEEERSEEKPVERNISLEALNIEIGKDLKPEEYDNEFELIKAVTDLVRERAPEEESDTYFEPEEVDDEDWYDDESDDDADDDEDDDEDEDLEEDDWDDEDDEDEPDDDEEEPLDDEIYTFYGVRFPPGNTVYSYFANEDIYECGNEVIVPAGPDNEEKVGEIVSINQFPAYKVPYPVGKMKYIIGKALK